MAGYVCAYMAGLGLAYTSLIAPSFSYLGYRAETVPLDLFVLSAVLGALPLLWLPLAIDRPSRFVYWLVYLLVVAPASVIAPIVLGEGLGRWLLAYAVMVLGFGIIGVGASVDVDQLVRWVPPAPPAELFWLGLVLFSMANYGLVFLQFGFALRFDLLTNLFSSELSATRLAARETFESSGSSLSGYSLAWQSGVVNPFLVAVGIVYRKPAALVGGVVGQIVLFSVAASKSMLISTLIVWACIYLLRPDKRGQAVPRMTAGVGLVVAVAAVHQTTTGSVALNSLVVRRAMATPAVLTRYYVDFFSNNPQTMLSQSVLGSVSPYPYEQSIPRTVGAEYVSEATSANANLFADAFANFGLSGIIMFSILAAAVFIVLDTLSSGKDLMLVTATFVTPGGSLVNSALLTSMLTHGILLALVLIAAFEPRSPSPPPERRESERQSRLPVLAGNGARR